MFLVRKWISLNSISLLHYNYIMITDVIPHINLNHLTLLLLAMLTKKGLNPRLDTSP